VEAGTDQDLPADPSDHSPASEALAPSRRPSRRTARRHANRHLAPPSHPWARRIGAGLAVLVLLAAAGGFAMFHYYDSRISRVAIRLSHHLMPPPTPAGAENFLLVGSDTRSFAGGPAFNAAPGSSDFVTGQRSDTVILVHLPAGDGRATIVSFPRDSWVQVPAYTDPQGNLHRAIHDKLNGAFAAGGAPLLVATLEDLSGLRIDHYVEVDFAGFQSMVDSLGGVTLCVATPRHDSFSGDFLSAGVHDVNGGQALSFVRDRHTFADQDLSRIKDQQYFLSVIMHKVLSAGTLANPVRLNSFLLAATQSLTVDQSLGFGDLEALAARLRHVDPAHVTFETLPFITPTYFPLGPSGPEAVEVDTAAAATLFTQLTAPPAPTQGTSGPGAPKSTSSTTEPLTVAPAQVDVEVENGAGVSGLARQTGDQLSNLRFSVTGLLNAPVPQARTVVEYGTDQLEAARTLAAYVPGSTVAANPSLGRSVLLVLGRGFGGVSATPGAAPVVSTTSTTVTQAGGTSPSTTAVPASAASLSCAP
jgi:LCP family protein required for cell wall assembly